MGLKRRGVLLHRSILTHLNSPVCIHAFFMRFFPKKYKFSFTHFINIPFNRQCHTTHQSKQKPFLSFFCYFAPAWVSKGVFSGFFFHKRTWPKMVYLVFIREKNESELLFRLNFYLIYFLLFMFHGGQTILLLKLHLCWAESSASCVNIQMSWTVGWWVKSNTKL